MAEIQPQAGPKRNWTEVRDEIIARRRGPELPSGVLIDAPLPSLYQPLPTEKHIRILVLQPASNLEYPIDCDLEIVLCTAESDYKALSYSWAMENGDCAHNRVISVRGLDISITQSLFQGLRRIRKKRDVVRIWVDALCIDQNDIQERNSQVAQMSQIFEHARETLVWLGEDPLGNGSPDEDNDAVLCAVRRLRSIRQPHEIRTLFSGAEHCICIHQGDSQCICAGPIPRGSNGTFETIVRWNSLFGVVPGLEQCLRPVLAPIARLFLVRYWTRRWIVQEYTSEPKTLIWGHAQHAALSSVDMTRLTDMCIIAGGSTYKSALTRASLMTQLTARVLLKGLLDYLISFREMQCSVEHDIIYSLISLSNPFDLVIDYDCTIGKLYRDLSSRAIADGHWNLILGNSGLDASRRAIEGSDDPETGMSHTTSSALVLPTWVADFKNFGYYPCSGRGAYVWLTQPDFIEDRLIIHAFFVAVLSHTQSPAEWVVLTGNEYMQHNDASRLNATFTIRTVSHGYRGPLYLKGGDLLFLPDASSDWDMRSEDFLVVRPRSELGRWTRMVVETVGVAMGLIDTRESQQFRVEEARVELEIV